jgi:phosphoribosyl 1,2-cyclic phosphate phosphodiesterase
MQLTFFGTAASEGYPNAFCACEHCERARALGGTSLRKRCSLLINDDLLSDMGPDLMAAAHQHGVSLAGLRYCLQTHAHEDHLDPAHFTSRSRDCSVPAALLCQRRVPAASQQRPLSACNGFLPKQ